MKKNHCNKRESRLGCWKILLVAILFPAVFLFMQTAVSAASLTLTQDSEVSLPETGVTLTATLVDGSGAVMADKWVTFVVIAGPNAWAFFPEDRKTNDKGEATFQYFGGNAELGSTDTIE